MIANRSSVSLALVVILGGMMTDCVYTAPASVTLTGATTIDAVINQPITPVTVSAMSTGRGFITTLTAEVAQCNSHPFALPKNGLSARVSGTSLTISGSPDETGVLCVDVRAAYTEPGDSRVMFSQPVTVRILVRPALMQISPTSVVAGSGDFTLTVTGEGFTPYAINGFTRVLWNGALVGTLISYQYRFDGKEITLTVPASQITNPGTVQISVDNSGIGVGSVVSGGMLTGATSLPFTITAAAPQPLAITTTSPLATATQGTAYNQTLQATGGTTPYVWAEVIGGGGSALPPGLMMTQAPGSNDAVISGTPTAGGVFNFLIRVTDAANPPATDTDAFSITVNAPVPAPTITTLTPNSAVAGGAGFTLTVDGANFDGTSVVNWNGSPRMTTLVSATQLTASILASDLVVANPPASVNVTVVNSPAGGGSLTSNAAQFTITAPPAPPAAGVLERISVDTAGNGSTTGQSPNAGAEGRGISMSADGRFAVFHSTAALDPGDTNGFDDAYMRDTCRGTSAPPGCTPSTTRITGVAVPEVPHTSPFISGDSQWIVYSADSNGANAALLARRTSGGMPTVLFSSSNFDRFHSAVLSRDGRFVAFATGAALAAANPLGTENVFLHDRDSDGNGTFDEAGGTQLVQVSLTAGGATPDFFSLSPAISADGRLVAFHSAATNLVANDTNAGDDIFLFDRMGNSITRVSVDSNGAEATALPFLIQRSPAISGDGRFITFASNADNLIPTGQDTNLAVDIFLRDTCFGAAGCTPSTIRVSISHTGAEAQRAIPLNPLSANSEFPAISFTGRFIAFASAAQNLVTGDLNIDSDTFVRDTCFGAPAGCTPKTIIVSVPLAGGPPHNGGSLRTDMSEDGSLVLFCSSARNLVPSDTSSNVDTFLAGTGLHVSLPVPPPQTNGNAALRQGTP